jgi:putative tricarboxylic transport membrane protein
LLTLFARRDALIGVILLVIGVIYGVLTSALPNRSLPNTPGPAFFPWLITGAFIFLSAALLIRSLRDGVHASRHVSTARDSRLPIFALTWFVIYLAALPFTGFLPASIPFFAGMMWFYGERSPLVLILAAIIVPSSLFYLFRHGFQILLPAGVW